MSETVPVSPTVVIVLLRRNNIFNRLLLFNKRKAEDISVVKNAMIFALLETANYAQQRRSSCGSRMKTSVSEDRHIIKVATEKRRLSGKGIKKVLAKEGITILEPPIRRKLYGANFICRRPVTTLILTLKIKTCAIRIITRDK